MFTHHSSQEFKPFRYKNLEDLKNELERLKIVLPLNLKTENLRKIIQIKDLIIANRLAIQPMEGFDAKLDGSPSELTFRRYDRYSRGGVGLIWFEATALSKKCQSNNHQLVLTEDNLNEFKKLVKITKNQSNETLKSLGFKDKSCLILQLNHSGRYSKISGKKYPIRAFHNDKLDKAISVKTEDGMIISDEEIKEIEELWINKAILAREAGFDGVDIKACHGYLISELLSAHIREDSIYGGKNLENRSRLFLNIISKLQQIYKNESDFVITSRLGIYNGNPYPSSFGVTKKSGQNFPAPVDLDEPVNLLNKLHDRGIRMANISMGNPHYVPYITRPYDSPTSGGTLPEEHPLFSVYRLLYLTSLIKNLIPQDFKLIGSGYSYFRQFAGNLASGAIQEKMIDICGFGRMSFANPNFARQIFEKGMIDKSKTCISCSKCSQLMRENKNTGCVVRNPFYKGNV